MAYPAPDRGPPPPTADLAAAESLAAVAVCAIHADGVVDVVEDNRVASDLARMRVFRHLEPEEVDGLLGALHEMALDVGGRTMLDWSARTVPPHLRETAFLLAADVMLTNGDLKPRERAFLGLAQRALGVSDAAAHRIEDVLRIKHRA